ncbi:MAG: 30S ribosomal protein S4 [Verrucomicrobia bacterium]|nr:30S ribosomal protein S4 [Verrucomicrobiota bacterium]
MSRYTGPVCRRCRREGMKLFLKGDRCYMAKCPIETGRGVPGMHGQRRSKTSDYGVQLREKQRIRRSYGLQEGQFRLFFQRASEMKGVTGDNLLQMLEMRLDNLVYRVGFAGSRKAAREFVGHGHIAVNGRKATVPSMLLGAGDFIEVRDRKNSRASVTQFMEAAESRGIVPWLKLHKKEYKGEVLHIPTREEINPPFNEQLVVELYSK